MTVEARREIDVLMVACLASRPCAWSNNSLALTCLT
jgi:hypothetical protein